MRADDTLGQGMDAALTLFAFLGIGFLLDRWLGTQPWLMIALPLVAAIGVFLSWKARYTAQMEVHEARLRHGRELGDDLTGHRPVDAEGETIDS